VGTKAAAHYVMTSAQVKPVGTPAACAGPRRGALRGTPKPVLAMRRAEADEFYASAQFGDRPMSGR